MFFLISPFKGGATTKREFEIPWMFSNSCFPIRFIFVPFVAVLPNVSKFCSDRLSFFFE